MKILSLYNSLTTVKKAMLWFTLCSVIQRGISFLTVPIFTRLMSQSEYGSFAVFQSWEQVAFYLVTLGATYGGFNTAMMKYKDDRDGYTSAVTGLAIFMGLLWLVLASFFAPAFSSLILISPSLIVLLFCEVIFQSIYDIWVCRTKFDFNYKKIIPASLSLAFITPALGAFLVCTMQDKTFARIFSFIAVEGVLAFFIFISIFKTNYKLFNFKYWKYTLSFNIPLIPHYLAQVILNQSDRIMISMFCGNEEVSIYTIAYSISMIAMVIITAINSALVPWMYREIEKKTFKSIRKSVNYMLTLIGFGITFISLLGPEIMSILAPSSYLEGADIIPPLAASVLFIFLYSLCSNIEFYYEKKAFATFASFTAAISNIILNFLFIPLLGYKAACFTTLFCYMLLSLLHYLFAQKVAKNTESTKILNAFPVVSITMFFLIISLCLPFLYHLYILRYILIGVIFAIVLLKRKKIHSLIKKMK